MISRPPLHGLRVVELATDIAGPYAAKLLADAGADVVKVEEPGGDPLRRWSASGHPPAAGDDAPLFRFLNTSKRSVTVDLERDREALLELAGSADLVIESLAPARSRALGLDGPALWRRSERVSLVSVTPFGREGPWRDWPASELTLQALCGSASTRGEPGGPPIAAGGRLGEWVGGAYTAICALSAWLGAARTGRGQHVDVSLLEVMHLSMATGHALYERLAGVPPQFPRSVEVPSIYPARDGWIGFCTITRQQWLDFLVLVERPDLQDDPVLWRWITRAPRSDELNAIVRAWTEQRTVAEILELAVALRIPVAEVGTGETLPRFDHFVERGVYVEHPGGAFVQPRVPYRLSSAVQRPFEPAPRLGESGDLGKSSAESLWREAPLQTDAVGPPPEHLLPLEGLRVVDFTAFWAGPFATHFLAALGAEVIKIESVQRPDGIRFSTVRAQTDEHWWEWSAFFQAFNPGKKSVTLDLTREEGRRLVKRLIADADLVVENFSPRVMDALGLRFEDLHAENPTLVMVRMPAFGLDGPWRDRVGFAQTMEQMSGMAWITGFPDGPPVIPRGPCDPLAGMHACVALQVALEQRRRTGEGQHIEATMVEAALNAAAEQVIEFQVHGVVLSRDGNRGPVGAPQNIYACRGEDQWLALSVGDDAQWQALREVLGDPSWARDPALDRADGRRARGREIDAELARLFAGADRDEIAARLLERGVVAAPVLTQPEAQASEQMRARGMIEDVAHPLMGDIPVAGLAARFSHRAVGWHRSASPRLGEHNDEILRGRLGLDADEMERLRAARVIGERLGEA